MKFARESWSVGYGIDRALVSALFVRDTLALSADTDPHIPGVEPSLPVAVPAGVDRRAVALEWPGWWEDAVQAFTQNLAAVELEHTEALLTRPACRAAVLALKPAIERLCEAKRSSALPIGDVMRAVEAKIGRRTQPGELHIAELPVDGLLWERIGPGHVLASTRFLNDPARTAPALRAVLESLV